MYELSRFSIIGDITLDTPLCVIIFVARSHGVIVNKDFSISLSKIAKLIDEINGMKIEKIEKKIPHNKLPLVARFVNPDPMEWSIVSLMEAFNSLVEFSYKGRGASLLPPIGFKVGAKSVSSPLNYDCTQLYAICKYHNLKTGFSTSEIEMTKMILALQMDANELREAVRRDFDSIPISELIRLKVSMASNQASDATEKRGEDKDFSKGLSSNMGSLSAGAKNKELAVEELKSVYNSLKSAKTLQERIDPIFGEEAIILAALLYNINISSAQHPIIEYGRLRKGESFSDPWLLTRFLQDRTQFNIRITYTPLFHFLYTSSELMSFFPQEINYSSDKIWLQGRSSLSKNEQSPISQEDLNNFSSEEIVTYGSYKELIAYLVSDLNSYLLQGKSLRDPSNAKLALSNMGTLTTILERRAISLEGRMREINNSLLTTIRNLQVREQSNGKWALSLQKYYDSCKESEQMKIKELFLTILDSSMSMRGWKLANKTYPLLVAETKTPENGFVQLFANVAVAVVEVEKSFEKLNEESRNLIEKLPLLEILSRGKDYDIVPNTQEEKGLTLFDRIKIVKEGKSPYSCMRTSSQPIAISCYTYLGAIGHALPFKASAIESVS
jgi:hypothetical protein